MSRLTGRIRHRTVDLNWSPRASSRFALILQVEATEPDGTQFWRDATTEDLTTITLNSLTEVKQQ